MKHLLRLAALLGLLILTGCPIPNHKPDCVEIVHLSFDGSLFDSSVNHFSVNATDTVDYAKDRFANTNGAAYLDGSATITIPSSPKLDFQGNSEYSISVWVRTRDTADASIVAKGEDAPVPGYSLQLRNGRPAAILTGNASPIELVGAKSIADNIWHLLTLSVTPDTIHLYADTTLVASGSGAQLAPQKNKKGPLYIGKLPNGTKPYDGLLDELMIRPCPQTHIEVNSNYRSFRPITLGDLPPGVTDTHGILDMTWVPGAISDTMIGYACGSDALLYRTTNSGVSWAKIQAVTGINPLTRLVAISFYDRYHGVSADDHGNLLKTADGGVTWTPLTISPSMADPDNQQLPLVAGLRYVDANTLVVAGALEWGSGGPGYIIRVDPTNGTYALLESSTIGEVAVLGSATNNNGLRLWAFGTDGTVRQYNLTSSTAVSVVQVTGTSTEFQSADFISANQTGFAGLAGTRNGQVWRYTESTTGGQTWTQEPGYITSLWVVGVRASPTAYSWTAATGLVSSVPVNEVRKRLGTVGSWTGVTSPSQQALFVSAGPGRTILFPTGGFGSTNDGLPGVLLQ